MGAFYSSISTIGSNGITLIPLASIGDMKNIHCIRERRTYIVFSVCLGSHALRTKNIHCISRLSAESKHCIWCVVGLALFKNEEYTLYLVLLGWRTLCSLQMAYRSTVYFSTITIGTNGTNRQVVSAALKC